MADILMTFAGMRNRHKKNSIQIQDKIVLTTM